jgi:hypothetical protein
MPPSLTTFLYDLTQVNIFLGLEKKAMHMGLSQYLMQSMGPEYFWVVGSAY